MAVSKKILIVEDEQKIIDVVKAYLDKDGYRTLIARDGSQALSLFLQEKPDLVLLDLMLPGVDGIEVCSRLRMESDIPILMLTARSSENDKIEGLSAGADDYLAKPFSPREMVARVRALLRRSSVEDEGLVDRLEFNNGSLVIDTVKRKVLVRGKELILTPSEYKLLFVLARRPGRVYERTDLIEKLRSYDFEGDERTIDTHIKNLRKKLEENPACPSYIKTVYGIGYKFEAGR